MIGTGLIEEQVLNTFIDLEPTQLEANQERGLFVSTLDIWSSDDEGTKKGIDV